MRRTDTRARPMDRRCGQRDDDAALTALLREGQLPQRRDVSTRSLPDATLHALCRFEHARFSANCVYVTIRSEASDGIS